ncbi:MAG: ATP-binding protein [Capnocytophaga sp.]|nr:ATP-binding protein [Capnocytophaga sp.]
MPIQKIKLVIASWFLLQWIVGIPVQAQSNIYVQKLTAEQGLSQNSVMAVCQDSLGFMWIGTRDGLSQYSGNKIKIYKHRLGDSLSIAGNHIYGIANAENGNIWVAHNKGVSLLSRTKETFSNYTMGHSANPEMRSIAVIDGQVWACGWSGVYKYDPQKNQFIKPQLQTETMNVFNSSVAKIIKSPFKNEYWIGCATQGLFKYDPTKDVMTPIAGNFGNVTLSKNERIEDIIFHPNGKIYVATYNNGIYECSPDGVPLKHWHFWEKDQQHPFGNIRTLALDKDDNIWIGGFQGIGLFNPQTGTLQEINAFHDTHLIDNPSVRSLFFDKNGSLWIGTYHDGVLLSDDYLSRFTPYLLNNDLPKNAHNIASAFAYRKGHLIVGSENGYLTEYDQNANRVKLTHIGKDAVIKSLFYDEIDDVLWIGTLHKGLYKEKNGKITAVGLTHLGVINQIIRESDSKLWIISDRSGGLNLFDTKQNQLTDFPVREKLHRLVGKSLAKHLLKIDQQRYMLASIGTGLLVFENTPNGKIERKINHATDVNHSLAMGKKFIISTDGLGVFVLNNSLQTIENYTSANGLLNDAVLSTITSGDDIWVNSTNGLSQLTEDGFVNYHIRNGFPLPEINQGAVFALPTEPITFVVGGKDAWVSFFPQKISKNLHKPSVYLSEIKINNLPINSIPKYKNINVIHPKKIELAHNQTAITFEFTGLNYLMPQNNGFKYMLEGFDIDWRYSKKQGIAEYGKIPDGHYTFRVQASNNDGIWSEELSFPVVVKPPFWLTLPAFLLYLLVAFVIIWYIRGNMLRKIALNHSIQLKEIEKNRLEEIHNIKVKYFADISHEIRTPLMLILSPIEEITEEAELKPQVRKKILNIQHHGQSLLKLVNQLLNINRIESNTEKLNETPILLKNFLENVNSSFHSLATKHGIDWHINMREVIEKPLLLDKEKIEEILLNLLSNAIKYTPKGGKVSLLVKTTATQNDTHTLLIEVIDSGIGIEKEALPFIFDRFYKNDNQKIPGSGIGLSLVKTIVKDLMKGEIEVESTVGKGSKFTVIIHNVKSENLTIKSTDYTEDFVLPTELTSQFELTEEVVIVPETNDKKNSILLVEDNIGLLNSLSEKLAKSFNLFSVTSAEDAMEILQEKDIDVVVSDIMLPNKSGKELCAEIKSNIVTSHIPVILITAIQHPDVKMESLELGADNYLTKPFPFKELQVRIINILRRQEKLRQIYKRDALPEKAETRFNKFDNDLLSRINFHIEKNLSNVEYSIEDLSDDVALSRVHLYRKMKKLLDVSPSRYMRDFRLKKAAEILAVEDIRMVDLADQVGFQDANYFLKCFKEKYGISPKEFSQGKEEKE